MFDGLMYKMLILRSKLAINTSVFEVSLASCLVIDVGMVHQIRFAGFAWIPARGVQFIKHCMNLH